MIARNSARMEPNVDSPGRFVASDGMTQGAKHVAAWRRRNPEKARIRYRLEKQMQRARQALQRQRNQALADLPHRKRAPKAEKHE